MFLSAVADLLAPALRGAEYAHRLESEVAARTREIDEQRRFTEKIIDSLPGRAVRDRSGVSHSGLESQTRDRGCKECRARKRSGGRSSRSCIDSPPNVLRSEFEGVFETGQMQQFPIESQAFGEPRTYRITKIPMHVEGRGGLARHHDRRRHHRMATGRGALCPGREARGDRHAGRRRDARDQQSAGDDRRLRRKSRARNRRKAHSSLPSDGRRASRLARCSFSRRCIAARESSTGCSTSAGPSRRRRSTVDLNVVVEKTLRSREAPSALPPRRRRRRAGHSNLAAVLANEEQMVQVFMALLLNALDAMEDSGVITLRTRADERDDTTIAEVIDRGHGIRMRGSNEDLRAILHDEAAEPRHRARTVDLLRDRHRARRPHRSRQRGRRGKRVPYPAAVGGRMTRA